MDTLKTRIIIRYLATTLDTLFSHELQSQQNKRSRK
jgi:hypothetical protein